MLWAWEGPAARSGRRGRWSGCRLGGQSVVTSVTAGWAGSSRPEPTGEQVAVGAAALGEPFPAFAAFVDEAGHHSAPVGMRPGWARWRALRAAFQPWVAVPSTSRPRPVRGLPLIVARARARLSSM